MADSTFFDVFKMPFVKGVIQEGKVRTVDMGGDAGTTAYTHALVDALE
jgi:hypothetical protein